MDDVRVYCRECHEEIHACEESWRNFIRSLPSHCILEFQSLVEELVNIEPDMAKGVAAYAKNDARRRRYNGGRKEPTKETKELVAEWYENFKAKLEEVE